MARLVTKLLQDAGYEVDLLPATVPADYTADAFVAIHADASTSGAPSGYKLARSRFSPIPLTDDALLKALTASYGAATGLRLDDNITRNMTGYYAFNSRRRVYAVSKGTPAVIIETGYLTNAGDRAYLLAHKDTVANGIAQGVINFLNTRPPLGQREKPSQTTPGVMVSQDNTPVYDQPDGAPVAYLTKGQRFEVYEVRNDYYMVFLPYLNKAGFVRRADATNLTLPR
jgi:N-acetylmuramoyl-L-alanine amidase